MEVLGKLGKWFKQIFPIFLRCIRVYEAFKLLLNATKTAINKVSSKVNDFAIDAGNETGILALTLMANRSLHVLERIFWFVIVLGSIFGAIKLSDLQIKRFKISPTVLSVDRDYRGWKGSLPAVTLCYYDHIDSFKASQYIQDNWNVSMIDEDYYYFMDFLYSVVNASANSYADIARFAEDERFAEVDLLELIRAIDRPFEQVITSFDADTDVEVLPIMTERGSCYAINAPFSELLTRSSMEYEELKPPLLCQFRRQQCFIKMDLYESTGTIDIHSPFEVSGIDANVFALHKSDEITASYKVLETVASESLRDLTVEQRKCVFHDEETSNLKIYSKSLCLVRCRAAMALQTCNCVPFFYPFVEGPTCNTAGFECLLDFKWPDWALQICRCPSTCTEIDYSIQVIKRSSWGAETIEETTKANTLTSSYRWDLIPPKVRKRRDVVFSFADLLVSFGGTIALFLGVSLLSITQLSYVLAHHILINVGEILLAIYKLCRRVMSFKRGKNQLNPSSSRSIKKVRPAKQNSAKHKTKEKYLTPVHNVLSENDNMKISFKKSVTLNSSYDNLNTSLIKPKFEYLE